MTTPHDIVTGRDSRRSSPLRVLILNQAAWPDVVATAQHVDDFARDLVAAGHEVHVVASRSTYGATGAALPAEETHEGVRLHRVGASVFGKRGLLLRALDFAGFHALALVRALRLPRPDVVVPLSTPPFLAVTGWLIARLRRAALVYWVMDLYPDVPVACGVMREGSPLVRGFEGLHRFVLQRCDRIVALGRCMRDRIVAKGIDATRLDLVRPWADAREIAALPRDASGLRRDRGFGGDFVVMYSGNFGIGHDVETTVRAAALLADRKDIRFVFVGAGKGGEEARRRLESSGARAEFLPYQPREALADSLAAGDAHLVTLRDTASGVMVPSKLFGILAAARPVLYVGPRDSEIARIVEEERCGVVIDCGDAEGLVRAVRELAADPARAAEMGLRGRKALEERYDRRLACLALRGVIERAAAGRSVVSTDSSR